MGLKVDRNAAWRTSRTRAAAPPSLTGITYQPFGPISGWQWGDGTHHTRDYDLDAE
jgi:hypothetical protein